MATRGVRWTLQHAPRPALRFLRRAVIGRREFPRLRSVEINRLALVDAWDMRESWNIDLFRAALSLTADGSYFVDVGANCGQTLLAVLRACPTQRYVGFEPQCEAAGVAQRMIDDNGLGQCRIFPVAIGRTSQVVGLGLGTTADQTASIARDYRPAGYHSRTRDVIVETGDTFLDRIDARPVGFLKIDVEGAEDEVLAGLTATTSEDRPIVMFEVLPDYLISTGEALSDDLVAARRERHEALGEMLAELDYRIFQIESPRTLVARERARAEDSGDGRSNFIAVPADRYAGFVAAAEAVGFGTRR
jgi:FkbM family methyltransferase